MHKPAAVLVMTALLSTAAVDPIAAQTRPAPTVEPTTRPMPLPPTTTRPVPLPGRPEIQPPRPVKPGRPEIQPPRPVEPGRPEIRPPVDPGYGYAATLRCESRRNQRQRCAADTDNRVQLLRSLGGVCAKGRNWGFDRRSIWVDGGCRAEFAYGRATGGGHRPEPDRDKGPSTGAIIAGVAVAGGLIALLASSANKKKKEQQGAAPAPEPETPATFPAGPPAALVADLSPLPSASRPSVQTCLSEAARQIGATGGTRLSYDRLVSLEPGNGGCRFGASLTATYPDGDRVLPFYCRATPTRVVQLDFANAQ